MLLLVGVIGTIIRKSFKIRFKMQTGVIMIERISNKWENVLDIIYDCINDM